MECEKSERWTENFEKGTILYGNFANRNYYERQFSSYGRNIGQHVFANRRSWKILNTSKLKDEEIQILRSYGAFGKAEVIDEDYVNIIDYWYSSVLIEMLKK